MTVWLASRHVDHEYKVVGASSAEVVVATELTVFNVAERSLSLAQDKEHTEEEQLCFGVHPIKSKYYTYLLIINSLNILQIL